MPLRPNTRFSGDKLGKDVPTRNSRVSNCCPHKGAGPRYREVDLLPIAKKQSY